MRLSLFAGFLASIFMSSMGVRAASIETSLVDPNATGETRILYTNLKNLSARTLLFGHQSTTFEGLSFIDIQGNNELSDVKTSVGNFPAVYGYDFIRGRGSNDLNTNFDTHVANAYARGGVVTFSWHALNPVTNGNAWDTTGNPVSAILSGGSARTRFLGWLDDIAAFANRVQVPIIFRPFHENTGDWFWWGTNATASQYRQLWQLTVTYLRDTKGVHNFLYAYSPSAGTYDSRYPGDDYVDIIGGDLYASNGSNAAVLSMARTLVLYATSRGKVAAITETGPRNGFDDPSASNTFYTNLLNSITNDSIARNVAYMLVWRNANETEGHFWVPLSGDPAHSDFVSYYNSKYTGFVNNLFDIYKPVSYSTRGWPYCTTAGSDPDGDGFGWEKQTSCVVPGSSADPSTGQATSSHPYCSLGAVDPDGNGYGWQNQKTCIVPGSPPDPDANW